VLAPDVPQGDIMGKSFRFHEEESISDTFWIPLAKINLSEKTVERLLSRDHAQIEAMRQKYEYGQAMVRVVLNKRCDGTFTIEDRRHRVLAARLANIGFIEAMVVGS
jgi:hypothetical protein